MFRAGTLALALGLFLFSGRPLSAGEAGLFETHELLRLTLEAPLSEVIRHSDDDLERPGVLRAGGRAIPVRLSAFGKSRLRVCELPPLKLEVDPIDVEGTVFDGQETLRIVTHCGTEESGSSERYVLLEYLVYRMYALVTEPALRVRLAEIEYHDTARRGRSRPALAYFVEDINRAAARHGLEWLDVKWQRLDDLDREQLSLLTLFQFMIGNTDWSILRGPQGERCCHNVAVLGRADGTRHLLPYDFDSSGLVDAPYARPGERLGLLQVTQRLYRGFCSNQEHLPQSIARFRALESRIQELVTDSTLPEPHGRASASKYLNQFFKVAGNPKKVEKQIRQRCRGGG